MIDWMYFFKKKFKLICIIFGKIVVLKFVVFWKRKIFFTVNVSIINVKFR